MRRLSVLGLIVCVSFVAVLGVAARPEALAQEGTPAGGPAVVGVTTEALGLGTAELAWPDRALASVSLFRFRFEPGAYIRIPAGQPGAAAGSAGIEMRNEGSVETVLLTVGVAPFDTGPPTPE